PATAAGSAGAARHRAAVTAVVAVPVAAGRTLPALLQRGAALFDTTATKQAHRRRGEEPTPTTNAKKTTSRLCTHHVRPLEKSCFEATWGRAFALVNRRESNFSGTRRRGFAAGISSRSGRRRASGRGRLQL